VTQLGLANSIVDRATYDRTVTRFREARIVLPTFAQLADPARIPTEVRTALDGVDPDAAHPLNLFRVHWFNDARRTGTVAVPEHVVLPEALTGVKAKIVVALGERFPMIHAHKVLAAYACLAPRVVTGQFDPTIHKALWPSTGNYCRGGVAISRIMGCRGVAILPQGMSAERFRWLEHWVADPADIVRTPGSESNVKEIYDACNALARDPANVVLNQFCEFGNHLAHYQCTGRALAHLFETLQGAQPRLALRAFVAATGSAGTLGAGDLLKDRHGARIVAVEALECPTMLCNGFGEHNIQGIGDKHIPLIHNVMNTDFVVAVSDRSTDGLGVLFNSEAGRAYLRQQRRIPPALLEQLPAFGLSSICNVLTAIKTAKPRPARTMRSSPSPPTARRCTPPSGRKRSARASVAVSTRRPPARRSHSTCWARPRTTCSSCPTSTARASSTSATSPGRAAVVARDFSAPRSRSAGLRYAAGGRHGPEFNRRTGVA
jgi:hypothetical protein